MIMNTNQQMITNTNQQTGTDNGYTMVMILHPGFNVRSTHLLSRHTLWIVNTNQQMIINTNISLSEGVDGRDNLQIDLSPCELLDVI